LKKFLRDEITDEDLKEIKKHNENRKLEVIEYVKELKKDIQEEENFIIAKSENINPALVGLIASKFESEYRKTTIVLFKDLKDNKYKGSGRTRSYNLQDFFTDKYKVKITGGGHEMAAGFDIDIDDYDLFVEELKNNVISETKIEVDGMIKNMNKVKLSHAKELSQLEPYGPPFFEPSFIFDLKNYKDIKLLKDIHLSMSNEKIKFINFNTDLNTVDINNLDNYYIIGSLNINKWMNRESLQIMVSNIIKKSDANIEKG
jgi:single-stranded DNA-specific DHH superfamily exonuclease